MELLARSDLPPQVVWLTCGNTSNLALRELLGEAWPRIAALLAEWAHAESHRTILARTARFTRYPGYYNTDRPHMRIHGRTPRHKLAIL